MLDLGKGLLDRIEVRGIGRQKQEPGSGLPDRLPYGVALMAAEIVHDHDVAGLKNGRQLLLGVRQKACAVDRPVEDARRGEPVQAQRADEGQRSPTARRLPFGPQPRRGAILVLIQVSSMKTSFAGSKLCRRVFQR
jgi:hypothetical protein